MPLLQDVKSLSKRPKRRKRTSVEEFVKAKKDVCIRNLLIEENKGLIFSVIRRYFNGEQYSNFKEDLFGYGVFGFIEAIEHFDPKRGEFSTCAFLWIRQSISREFKQFEHLIRLPENVVREVERLKSFLLEEKEKEDPAKHLDVSPKKVKLLGEVLSSYTASFSDPISTRYSGGGTVGDFIPAPNQSVEETTHFALVHRRLKTKLPPRDYEILSRVFGLDGKGQRIFEEVRGELGMKKQTFSKAYSVATERAKKIMKCAGITSSRF